MLSSAAMVAFVPVSDLSRARAFYVDILGLEVQSGDDYGCVLRAHGSLLRLAQVGEFERPAHTVLGWEVPDIAGAISGLISQGVAPHRYDGMEQDDAGVWASPSGDLVAWFPDSEGNNLSLTQVAT